MQQLDPKAVWLFFINALFSGTAIVLVGLYAGYNVITLAEAIDRGVSITQQFAWIVFPAVIIWVVGAYIYARLVYYFYRYELREDGFRKELGVIWKKYVTIPYDRIQNVDIYRGVIDRILGLSVLGIQTAGASASVSRYGIWRSGGAEGVLPGLSREVAEQLRDELIKRARQAKTSNQGL